MKQIPTKTSLLSFDSILKKADLKEGHTVADFGCGNALFFLYSLWQKVGQDGKVYGVDIIPEVVNGLKRDISFHNLAGATVLEGNLDSYQGVDLADESLDRAFLINTIHQSGDRLTMLKEAARTINPQGLLIVIDWATTHSPFGPHESRRLSAEAIKESAEIIGLNLSEEFQAGPYHYGLIFTKK